MKCKSAKNEIRASDIEKFNFRLSKYFINFDWLWSSIKVHFVIIILKIIK